MSEVDEQKVFDELKLTTTGYTNLKTKPPTDKNSHWYKALLELGVLEGAPPPPPPPPPPPTSGQLYGVPYQALSLFNKPIKGSIRWEYGFNSIYSGDTKSIGNFFVFRASGYTAGDGGKVRVELVDEANGQVLGGYTIDNPKASSYPRVPMEATLAKGKRYRVRYTNPDKDNDNWVSTNDIATDGKPNPGQAYQNLVAYENGSVNNSHCPVFDLEMADGTHQGGPFYIDSPGRWDDSDGHAEILITPQVARSFTAVHVYVSGSGTVRAALNGASGQASIKDNAWTQIPMTGQLQAGVPKTLVLDGNFTIEALQKGSPNPAPDWRAVVSGQTNVDFPAYLT